MSNLSILTQNILLGLQHPQAEQCFFRMRDLGFSELEAERHAQDWRLICEFLEQFLPIAGKHLTEQRPELVWTPETQSDLIKFIRVRHEHWIRREK